MNETAFDNATVMENITALEISTALADAATGQTKVFSAAEIILTTIDISLIVIITVGNTLTIAAVCRFKRLQNPSNVMISFLAVCDLVMGPVYTPVKILYVTWPHIFASKIPCMYAQFIAHFSGYCAAMGLSAMSLERAYAVQFPFHYHSCVTIRRAVCATGVALSVALIMNLPFIAGLGQWNSPFCLYNLIYPRNYIRVLIFVILCVFIMGFAAFVRVLVAELRRQKQIMALESQRQSLEKKSSRKSRLMCTIYVSSLICWTPHLIYYLYDTITLPFGQVITYRSLSLFDLSSSAINFLIYGIKNSKFRRAYKQLLGCKISSTDSGDIDSLQQSTTMTSG